jgi:hypothetical protein
MSDKRYLKIFQTEADYNNNINNMELPYVVLIEKDKIIERIVFENVQHKGIKDYFTIEATSDGVDILLTDNTLEFSIDDGKNWTTLPANNRSGTFNKGTKIRVKINNPSTTDGIGTFQISRSCNIKGNIMSLLYGDDFVDKNDLTGIDRAFYNLFSGCTAIHNAEGLILPAVRTSRQCYNFMFYNCTSLKTPPTLLATQLADYSCQKMFYNCTSLRIAPELPATILSKGCYSYMFQNCTSLTTVPKFSATTLSHACCEEMFCGCTSLIDFPEVLPAKSLASRCYQSMFYNCISLTEAPALPAETLAYACYYAMFKGCSSLTTAPDLPATTLQQECYATMFEGCSKLNKVKILGYNNIYENSLTNWLVGTAGGTIYKSVCLLDNFKIKIPLGWTIKEYGVAPSIINLSSTPTIEFNINNTIYIPSNKNVDLLNEYEESMLSDINPKNNALIVDIVYIQDNIGEKVSSSVLWQKGETLQALMDWTGLGNVTDKIILILSVDE